MKTILASRQKTVLYVLLLVVLGAAIVLLDSCTHAEASPSEDIAVPTVVEISVMETGLMVVDVSIAPAPSTAETMPYCTPDNVTDTYGEDNIARITGDASGSAADPARVQSAVDDYGDYIETHVRMQHPDNPFDETDAFLRGINIEGAYITLQKRSAGGADEEMQKAEARLDKILMRIASGEIDLLDEDDLADAPSERLVPSELIRARPSEFGIHRRYPDLLDITDYLV